MIFKILIDKNTIIDSNNLITTKEEKYILLPNKTWKLISCNITNEIYCSKDGYIYDYIDTEIQCIFCNSKFKHTKLLNGIYNKCPFCEKENCCLLNFQNIEEIL